VDAARAIWDQVIVESVGGSLERSGMTVGRGIGAGGMWN